jgi:hypothetical protein
MVTACAIILGGLWTHAESINDRLRAMNRERLDLWRQPTADAYTTERLAEIDAQAPVLLRRHHRVRQAIVMAYTAIMVFILSMFAIALAVLRNATGVPALLLFLTATLLLLVAVVLAILEIRISHTALEYETNRVEALRR